MAILTVADYEHGDRLMRGEDTGVITWPVNSHWADVAWTRPNGTTYSERAYLPECTRVNEALKAA